MEIITKPWQGRVEELISQYQTSTDGLDGLEAQKRLLSYGANNISRNNPIPYLQIIFDQFVDLLVLLLLFASILSYILGDVRNGSVILFIVILNAVIGFSQEFKAEKIIRALGKFIPTYVRVKRRSEEIQIPAKYLVPGDIVILGEGDKVPADIRLIEAYDLKTNEQSLTGETKDQSKRPLNYMSDKASLIEVENCLFMGTTITSGQGLGLVTSTGMLTEFGKIAQKATTINKTLSPLQEKTQRMAKRVAVISVIIMIGLIVYKYLQGGALIDALIFSVAVAASMVPEGLPATISVALSLGARELASHRALVRNLVSVETLGSVTVICTDKTGTLTTGRMSVKEVWSNLNSEIKEPEKKKIINEILVLCNDAQINTRGEFGDPTEISLLKWVRGQEDIELLRQKYTKITEVPFNSERRFMSVTYGLGGTKMTFLKGAAEVIISKCHLNNHEKTQIQEKYQDFTSQGFRVLAIAYNEIFIGLVAIYDPPRREVKESLEKCQNAGIKVFMITGDNALTAKSIAEMVGIGHQNDLIVVEGNTLDKMSDTQLKSILRKTPIFARILPNQKYRIVDQLMKMGEIVAVTGDGVNDAPALKRADIGIAMGLTGTDVSREAADMILLDDNFSTIVRAVEEGRAIFDNIKKFLFYIFSSNFGELSTVVMGMFLGIPLPLTAIQILSVDVGTDVFPSMGLIAEPSQGEVIKSLPRSKNVQLLTGESFIHLTILGLIMGTGAVINFMAVLKVTGSYEAATTASLATLVICQGFNIFLCRCPDKTILKYPFWQNKYLLLAVFSSMILVYCMTYLNFFHKFLSTDAIPFVFWPQIVLVGIVLLVIEEIYKVIKLKFIYHAK